MISSPTLYPVRSYHHYCGLAKALDVVGDRWSLLIVRELLVGPRRYGELLDGLPGIATNLLVERLRHLESAGVLGRDDSGSYRLTEWGEGLAEPLYALGAWASPLMGPMDDEEAFRGDWLVHPLRILFSQPDGRRPDVTIELRADDSPVTFRSAGGRVLVEPGTAQAPDLVITGRPDGILGWIAGRFDYGTARLNGVHAVGDIKVIGRLRPTLRPSARLSA